MLHDLNLKTDYKEYIIVFFNVCNSTLNLACFVSVDKSLFPPDT